MAAVPLIQPSTQVGGLPAAPSLDPASYANLSTFGLRAAARAAEDIAGVVEQQRKIRGALAEQTNRLEAEQALGEYDRQAADRTFAIQSDPSVTPEEYADRVERELRAVRQGVEQDLTRKAPGAMPHFQIAATRRFNTDLTKAKYEGFARRVSLNKASIGLLNDRDTNAYVFAVGPDGEPDEAKRSALAEGIARRTEAALQSRTYSADEYEAEMRRQFANMEEGDIRRDFRNPTKRAQVIDGLTTGRYTTMAPDKQLQLAQTLSDQDEADRRNAAAEAKRQYEADKDKALSDLYARADKKKLTEAEYDAAVSGWQLTPAEQKNLRSAMTAPVDERPSDPATYDDVVAKMASITPQITAREIDQLKDAGRLNRKDWQGFRDKLKNQQQWLLTHGESEQGRRLSQAEQNLRANLGIPSLGDIIDQGAKKAWGLAHTEITLRTLGGKDAVTGRVYRGGEDPIAVAQEITPRYQKLLGDSARASVEQIDTVLKYPSSAALEAALATGKIKPGGDYDTQKRLLIQREEQQKKIDDAERKRREEEARKPAPAPSLGQRLRRGLGLGGGTTEEKPAPGRARKAD